MKDSPLTIFSRYLKCIKDVLTVVIFHILENRLKCFVQAIDRRVKLVYIQQTLMCLKVGFEHTLLEHRSIPLASSKNSSSHSSSKASNSFISASSCLTLALTGD
jgi:hypothetical protein